jgi:diguanylate cyclase
VTDAQAAELEQLRAEVQRARAERDALAARVRELEQQLVPPPAAQAAAPSFDESFRIEQSRAKRHGRPLSMALVELDGLQDLRDRLGHAAGEAALGHLGRLLEQSLRPTDVVARVDGLAYGLLLPSTGLEQALAALTRLQSDVAAVPFDSGHAHEVLTFSSGLVQWRADEAPGDLLSRASRALGLARRGGSARIVLG